MPRTRRLEAWPRLVQKFGMSQTAALRELGALLNSDFGAKEAFRATLFQVGERGDTVPCCDERTVYRQDETRCGADEVAG